MVIDDTACNLSRYAPKGETGFLAKTRFRIDRVHQGSRPKGYNSTSYPDNCPVLGGSMRQHAITSQVCEQAHSSSEAISTLAKFASRVFDILARLTVPRSEDRIHGCDL